MECFHLLLLRLLEVRLDRADWVVKGGVNLRAWFGSVRYSEDLDIDLVRGSVHRVQERIDTLLGSAAFRDLLAAQGLELARSSKPKQTETTQRWKFEVRAEGHLLFYNNEDRPGVVAAVSARLADAGVNIAGLALGRERPGGTALTVMTTDEALAPDVLEALAAIEGVRDVRAVSA